MENLDHLKFNQTKPHDCPQQTTSPDVLSEYSPLKKQPELKSTYSKIALISHPDHIHALKLTSDQLIVTSDWITWRQCLDIGHHSIHLEAFLNDWPKEEPADFFHQNSSSWMYADNQDITLFRGVSLGKQFNKPVFLFNHGYTKISYALNQICKKYRPKKIEFHDIRADHDALDDFGKITLVNEIAKKHQISLIDFGDRKSSDLLAFHDLSFQVQIETPKNLKYYLRFFYEIAVDIFFRTRFLFIKPGKRVYLLLNWPALKNLFKNKEGKRLNPVVLAHQNPKNLGFILDCWRKNILLARLPFIKFNKADNRRLNEIRFAIENSLSGASSPRKIAQQRFIERNFLESGRYRRIAANILSYGKLFEQHKVAHLVVGDAGNGNCRLLLEIANLKNIPADELLNGMFLTDEYFDARSGDNVHKPYIKRLLSWGENDEIWLANQNKNLPFVRTGYPALENINTEFGDPLKPYKKALILPISMEGVKSLNTNIFATMVDLVRGLKVLGCTSVRIKVHVGHPVKEYFQRLCEYFQLECEISQSRVLEHHIEWADFVVGPIDSGAFVETLAKGKPFYPMRLYPSSLRRKYFGNVKPSESVPELLTAVREKNFPNPSETLEFFCSSKSIANPSKRVWEVLENSTDPNRC